MMSELLIGISPMYCDCLRVQNLSGAESLAHNIGYYFSVPASKDYFYKLAATQLGNLHNFVQGGIL